MLESFITSSLIIDDDKTEVDDLIAHLEAKDIWTKYYHPDSIKTKTKAFNNRKLIFLDLYLNDSINSKDNIAQIRKYFNTIINSNFGTYGIVLWTKHTNHFNEFCDKIFLPTNKFTLPLFVIPLDKLKYKTQGNFDGVLDDLEEKLKKDVSSSLFIEWNKAVKSGSDNTIENLYKLFESQELKRKNLEPVLYKLATNFTGIPKSNLGDYNLQKDLIKSLMDSLQFEISENFIPLDNLFMDPNKLNFSETEIERNKVYSKLNSLLMLDSHNLSQNSVIPGNVYEILEKDSPLYITDVFDKKRNECNIDTSDIYKDLSKRRICIEVTPPCDFAQSKKQQYSRILGGIQMDYDKEILKGSKSHFKTDNYYTFLYPIEIIGFDKPQMIIFDFYRFQTLKEDILKDGKKYSIIFRAKDKLFADVLQKLSSHTSRLGIGVLQ